MCLRCCWFEQKELLSSRTEINVTGQTHFCLCVCVIGRLVAEHWVCMITSHCVQTQLVSHSSQLNPSQLNSSVMWWVRLEVDRGRSVSSNEEMNWWGMTWDSVDTLDPDHIIHLNTLCKLVNTKSSWAEALERTVKSGGRKKLLQDFLHFTVFRN